MINNYSILLSMLINKVFFLKTPKNKDWWKKDYSKDVVMFLSFNWICVIIAVRLDAMYRLTSWLGVLLFAIVFFICFASLLISYAAWTESKHLQLMDVVGEKD